MPHGRGVVRPGDDGGPGAGAGGALRRVQRLRHADGGGVDLRPGPLQRQQVGVDTGHDHRDPLGLVQVTEHFGGVALSGRVEGQEMPTVGQHRPESLHPAQRVGAAVRGEPDVVHAPPLDRPRLNQGPPVGVVAQGDRGAVQIADDQRVPVGERGPLRGGERGEELRQPVGRCIGVRQRVTRYPPPRPGGECDVAWLVGRLVTHGCPAGGRQHHEHDRDGEQCAPCGERGEESKEVTPAHIRRRATTTVKRVTHITRLQGIEAGFPHAPCARPVRSDGFRVAPVSHGPVVVRQL